MLVDDDMTRATDGSIPWSVDEYLVVLEEHKRLELAAPDDLDLRPRQLPSPALDGEEGTSEPVAYNVNLPANQLGLFMAERYRHLGPIPTMSHIRRFYTIAGWLSDELNRLVVDGWITLDTESDAMEVHGALLEALVELPYDRPGGRFVYPAVVQRAEELAGERSDTA